MVSEMSSELLFSACIRRPDPWPSDFLSRVFRGLPSKGLRFGDYYADQELNEDPPFVYSSRGTSRSESDFARALETSEKQGWGWIAYEFDLQDGDGRPEPLDFAIKPHPESDDGRWLVAELSVRVSHLHSEEEMTPFLESIVIPTSRELKPVIAVGDVTEAHPYLPTIAELDQAKPSDACWFNQYGPSAVKAIGEDHLRGLQGLPRLRLVWLEEGGVILVLQPLPMPDPRDYVRTRLKLEEGRNPHEAV
jgi:hypothetical protein